MRAHWRSTLRLCLFRPARNCETRVWEVRGLEVRVVELKCRYATLITGAVYGEALQQDKQKYASYTFKRQQQKTGIVCRFLFYCAISWLRDNLLLADHLTILIAILGWGFAIKVIHRPAVQLIIKILITLQQAAIFVKTIAFALQLTFIIILRLP